ncbi:MAG: hypothetical protein KJP18_04280 [Gemmatimonadetes bacterium]|nr:hypothetical protein [Gemmatimonadota bacterium]NNK64615.1 hypothetical protein [Gemmatimonadota bacterium]
MSRVDTVFERLLSFGVTDAVGLPDSVTAPLMARFDRHPATRWVAVTREGEAFALAAGLWVGGRTPIVVIQNTGLLESGDSLRGVAVRAGVPLLCIVTYRGRAGMKASGWNEGAPLDRAWLVRPDVDSTALLTEPTLQAWGMPYRVYESPADLDAAWRIATEEQRPVVLLLAREPVGAPPPVDATPEGAS